VKAYVEAVRAAAGRGAAAEADLDGVAAELEGEDGAAATEADAALASEPLPADGGLLAAAAADLPALPADAADLTAQDARALAAMRAEYDALQAVNVAAWDDADLPDGQELDILGEYLQSTADYVKAVAGFAEPAAPAFNEAEDGVLAGLVNEDMDAAAEPERGAGGDFGGNFQERIIDMARVTKVVKGGKLMGFRCVAVIGNQAGVVGVGVDSGREVTTAVKRALVDARKNLIRVPLVGAGTVPHRVEAKAHASKVLVVPASDGTGCVAGGAVRAVLELAGVRNCLSKRVGTRNPLNTARATVAALSQLRTLQETAAGRDLPLEALL